MSIGSTIQKAVVIAALGAAAGYAHWALRGPINLAPDKSVTTTIELDDPMAADPVPVGVNDSEPGETAATPATTTPATETPPPAAPRTLTLGFEITLEQAKLLHDRSVTFLDARHAAEYEAGHIQNAFQLAADELPTDRGQQIVGMLPMGQPIVIYCGGGDCDASHNLANRLQQLGFTGTHIFVDGYPAWAGAGLPVEVGPGMF